MIYIYERKDVDEEIEQLGTYIEEVKNQLYEAYRHLDDYACDSIYEDSSKGCYEDNISYVDSTKADVLRWLKELKEEIIKYEDKFSKIEAIR